MEVTREDFPRPLIADMELLELHVGCVARDPALTQRAVAVFLQPADALVTEQKVGAILADWIDVLQFVTGVLEAAHEAWPEPKPPRPNVGPPPRPALVKAARAVVERWDTPLWKEAPATAEVIHRLRAALAEEASPEDKSLPDTQAMRDLLVELRSARPLLLYGEDWVKRIDAVLGI